MISEFFFSVNRFLEVLIILILSGCGKADDAEVAAGFYCNCVINQKWQDLESAKKTCDSQVTEKFRLLRIYYDTRDTTIQDLYSEKTVDSVFKFVYKYCMVLDSLKPPGWLRDEKDSNW